MCACMFMYVQFLSSLSSLLLLLLNPVSFEDTWFLVEAIIPTLVSRGGKWKLLGSFRVRAIKFYVAGIFPS